MSFLLYGILYLFSGTWFPPTHKTWQDKNQYGIKLTVKIGQIFAGDFVCFVSRDLTKKSIRNESLEVSSLASISDSFPKKLAACICQGLLWENNVFFDLYFFST